MTDRGLLRGSPDGLPLAVRARSQAIATWLVRRSGVRVIRIRILGAERSRLFAKSGDKLWPRIEIQF
jgi:1-acyl-sn-glycerol-3-phosphate acyltransferase